MVKKLFALASISGLTGLVVTMAAAGCSSTTTSAGPDTTTDASSATDATKTPPKEAAADDAAVTPGVCPTTDVITSADIAMQLKWMPPLSPQNVCVQKNIDDLRNLIIKNGTMGTKFTDIQTALGATCAACAFSKDTAANWQPYVQTTTGFLSNRTASCLAQVESAACGKAAFELDICGKIACNTKDCPSDAEVTACQKKAFAKGGACNAIGQTFVTACPNEAVQLDPATGPCATSPQSIAVSCAGGADGGLDASLP